MQLLDQAGCHAHHNSQLIGNRTMPATLMPVRCESPRAARGGHEGCERSSGGAWGGRGQWRRGRRGGCCGRRWRPSCRLGAPPPGGTSPSSTAAATEGPACRPCCRWLQPPPPLAFQRACTHAHTSCSALRRLPPHPLSAQAVPPRCSCRLSAAGRGVTWVLRIDATFSMRLVDLIGLVQFRSHPAVRCAVFQRARGGGGGGGAVESEHAGFNAISGHANSNPLLPLFPLSSSPFSHPSPLPSPPPLLQIALPDRGSCQSMAVAVESPHPPMLIYLGKKWLGTSASRRAAVQEMVESMEVMRRGHAATACSTVDVWDASVTFCML